MEKALRKIILASAMLAVFLLPQNGQAAPRATCVPFDVNSPGVRCPGKCVCGVSPNVGCTANIDAASTDTQGHSCTGATKNYDVCPAQCESPANPVDPPLSFQYGVMKNTGPNPDQVVLGGPLAPNTNTDINLPTNLTNFTFSGLGNVGIGTPSPTSKLDVEGSAEVKNVFRVGNYRHVLSAGFSSTAVNGYLLTTAIPYNGTVQSGMHTIRVQGYSYGTAQSVDFVVNFYLYSSGFTSYGWTNYGAYDPGAVKLSYDGGFVKIWWSNVVYYPSFEFFTTSWIGQPVITNAVFEGWTLTDAPAPPQPVSPLVTVDLPYRNATPQGITASGNISAANLTATGVVTAASASLSGALSIDGNTVIDDGGGWHRSYGNTGWYNGTYGGGWHMLDTTWVRSYLDKSVWTGNGVLGSQAGLSIGYGGTTPPSNGALIAGNVGIGTTVVSTAPFTGVHAYGDRFLLSGPNSSWGGYLQVGGNNRQYVNSVTVASVAASDGNLHMDAGSGKDLYLNYYDGANVYFGSGANSSVASVSSAGVSNFTGNMTVGPATATYINLRDDESPNGVKSIHANSNNIGFLSGAGGWLTRWDDAGNQVNTGAVYSSYYMVNAGNGQGVCFWTDCTNYKIHMGTGAEYQYGPVTDYSVKMNMNSTPGRGWTWGQPGAAPIAALNNVGSMQVAGSFTAGGRILSGTDSASNGSLILAGRYAGPNDVLNTFGGLYSSGGTMIGFGVKPRNGAAGYVSSTTAGPTLQRAAITMDGTINFLTSPPVGVLPDLPVTMNTAMTIANNGNVGIGASAAQKLSVGGVIESTTGGFRFPDGTTQATAAGAASGNTTSSGTSGYVPKFNGANSIINSQIQDNGTNVGIGGVPASKLDVTSGSLRVHGTSYEGAGQIQSTGTIRFANAGAAQGIYTKQISVSDSWADNDTNTQTNGIYSKGNLRVGSGTPMFFVNTSTGFVGAGTAAPSKLFEAADTGTTDREGILTSREGHNAGLGIDRTGALWGLNLYVDGAKKVLIDSNAGVGIGATYASGNPPANGLLVEGSVGVGTTTTTQKFTVNGTSEFQDTTFFGASGSQGLISWGSMGGGAGFAMRANTGRALSLGSNGNWDNIVVDTAGEVGIGVAAPNSLLHLYKTAGNNAELDLQSTAAANSHWAMYHDRASDDLRFWHLGADRFMLRPNGDVNITGQLTVNGQVVQPPNSRHYFFSSATIGDSIFVDQRIADDHCNAETSKKLPGKVYKGIVDYPYIGYSFGYNLYGWGVSGAMYYSSEFGTGLNSAGGTYVPSTGNIWIRSAAGCYHQGAASAGFAIGQISSPGFGACSNTGWFGRVLCVEDSQINWQSVSIAGDTGAFASSVTVGTSPNQTAITGGTISTKAITVNGAGVCLQDGTGCPGAYSPPASCDLGGTSTATIFGTGTLTTGDLACANKGLTCTAAQGYNSNGTSISIGCGASIQYCSGGICTGTATCSSRFTTNCTKVATVFGTGTQTTGNLACAAQGMNCQSATGFDSFGNTISIGCGANNQYCSNGICTGLAVCRKTLPMSKNYTAQTTGSLYSGQTCGSGKSCLTYGGGCSNATTDQCVDPGFFVQAGTYTAAIGGAFTTGPTCGAGGYRCLIEDVCTDSLNRVCQRTKQ